MEKTAPDLLKAKPDENSLGFGQHMADHWQITCLSCCMMNRLVGMTLQSNRMRIFPLILQPWLCITARQFLKALKHTAAMMTKSIFSGQWTT
jgi:hypothetical protein